MDDKTSDLIAIAKEAFPVRHFFRGYQIAQDRDKKLMADLGLSRSAYLAMLSDFDY